jgi:hypothetical protein
MGVLQQPVFSTQADWVRDDAKSMLRVYRTVRKAADIAKRRANLYPLTHDGCAYWGAVRREILRRRKKR